MRPCPTLTSMITITLLCCPGLPAAAVAGTGDEPPAAEKIRVTGLDQLPRHSYPVEGPACGLLTSDEGFEELASMVRFDIEDDLATYAVDDAATMQDWFATLHRLDMLEGRYEEAMSWLDRARDLEEKEALRLMSGLTARAWVAARASVEAEAGPEALRAAYQEQLARAVAALPWEVVQDRVEKAKGRAEIISANLVQGMCQSQLEPIVAHTGALGADAAHNLIAMRYALRFNVPYREQNVAVFSRAIAANRVVRPDIWAARAVELDAGSSHAPVLVAIWDSGVDVQVFGDQVFVNRDEKPDGLDNDGNGFVDDVNGIAFDLEGRPTQQLLHPVGEMGDRLEQIMHHAKGFIDLNASVDSPEATALKRHIGGLQPDEIEQLIEDLGFCSVYLHGTHVAGIAVAGNPFARILPARITFDYHSVPAPLTAEVARRHAASYTAAVTYFRAHGVRLANMSWGWTLREVEANLEANGIGETAEERAGLTREVFQILSEGLHKALGSAPEILFVVAAGNDDDDVEFGASIPASFELPNILVVGAVDQAGDPTAFTSTGRNVVLYANGFEVESYVPGGERMAGSGTSMSAPGVINLAAKLLALDPELGPAELIDLITRGADPRRGDEALLLVNPKRTVELLAREEPQ